MRAARFSGYMCGFDQSKCVQDNRKRLSMGLRLVEKEEAEAGWIVGKALHAKERREREREGEVMTQRGQWRRLSDASGHREAYGVEQV